MDIRFSFSGPFLCHQMFQHRQRKSMCKEPMEGVSFSASVVGQVVAATWCNEPEYSRKTVAMNHNDQFIYFNDTLCLISGNLLTTRNVFVAKFAVWLGFMFMKQPRSTTCWWHTPPRRHLSAAVLELGWAGASALSSFLQPLLYHREGFLETVIQDDCSTFSKCKDAGFEWSGTGAGLLRFQFLKKHFQISRMILKHISSLLVVTMLQVVFKSPEEDEGRQEMTASLAATE